MPLPNPPMTPYVISSHTFPRDCVPRPASNTPTPQRITPTMVTVRGPTRSCQRPPKTAPRPRKKIAVSNGIVASCVDQLNPAISEFVKILQEYAVPRQSITTIPASAMPHRLPDAAGADDILQFSLSARVEANPYHSRLRHMNRKTWMLFTQCLLHTKR